MKTLTQTYHIQATLADVWQALVDPGEIDGWDGGPAVMDEKVGTEFKLWGGEIWGKNIEVIPGKKLVQEWNDTQDPIEPTILTLTLAAEDAGTIVELLHTNIPDDRADDIEQGWQDYYMGPLKEYVENREARQ